VILRQHAIGLEARKCRGNQIFDVVFQDGLLCAQMSPILPGRSRCEKRCGWPGDFGTTGLLIF
jgi:hypothetical protein